MTAHCALRVRLSSCSHHVLPSLADPLRQFLLTPADDTVHRRSSAERSIWEFLSHTQERPGTDPEALETVWMPGSAPRPPGEGVTTRTPAPGRRDRAEARPSLTALARPTSTLLPSEAGASHDPTSCRGWRGGDMYLESGRKGTCCLDDAGQAASVVAAHRTLCILCTTQGHSRRSQTSTTSGKGHTGARPPSPAPRRDDWEVGG